MAESFQIIAPKLELKLPCGAIGDILFDSGFRSVAEKLARLLTVPVKPSTANAPSNLKTSSKGNNTKCEPKMREGHKNFTSNPDRASEEQQQEREKSLLNFPTEIDDLIFGYLNFEDIIHFGITSLYCWDLVQRQISIYHMSLLGRWAGYNIVHLGSASEPGEFPPGLITEDGKKLIPGSLSNAAKEYAALSYPSFHYLPGGGAFDRSIYARGALSSLESSSHSESRCRASDLTVAHFTALDDYCATNQAWILRNLTTNQFVRSEEIALRPDLICGPTISGVGFGHVVLMRIGWSISLHAATRPGLGGILQKGLWAGHFFEITTLEAHLQQSERAPWKTWEDVSDEVCREIAEAWGSRYGFDWHRQLVKVHEIEVERIDKVLATSTSGLERMRRGKSC